MKTISVRIDCVHTIMPENEHDHMHVGYAHRIENNLNVTVQQVLAKTTAASNFEWFIHVE